MRFRRPGQYQLQAAITAVHVRGADTGTTDWERIAELYRALGQIAPSPVVELNRAAAVGFAVGPQAGLELLEPLLVDPALERYQPLTQRTPTCSAGPGTQWPPSAPTRRRSS